MNLDDNLRRALQRQPAPPELVDRVLARIASSPPKSGLHDRNALRWLALAAGLTLVVAGGAQYYVYQQTVAEAERVKAEIRLALQITSKKIAEVQVRLKPDTTYERVR
jgi:hypothetical protein